MLSDSISARTLVLLFLYAVEFFAALNNTCISARTLALLLLYNSYICCAVGICSNKANVPVDLQSAGIEYKDFSITSVRKIILFRLCCNG